MWRCRLSMINRIPRLHTKRVRNIVVKIHNFSHVYDEDDDEEPYMHLDPKERLEWIDQLNTQYYKINDKITNDELYEIVLNKWNKMHEIIFYKNKKDQLTLCILETCAGDHDYKDRLQDVVDVINEYQLGDTIKYFIDKHPIHTVPANGIECIFNIIP